MTSWRGIKSLLCLLSSYLAVLVNRSVSYELLCTHTQLHTLCICLNRFVTFNKSWSFHHLLPHLHRILSFMASVFVVSPAVPISLFDSASIRLIYYNKFLYTSCFYPRPLSVLLICVTSLISSIVIRYIHGDRQHGFYSIARIVSSHCFGIREMVNVSTIAFFQGFNQLKNIGPYKIGFKVD